MIGDYVDTMANLEYGILIAIVVVALLMLSIASCYRNKRFNAISYIIGILLLIPITFQMSRLIGACQVLNEASTIEDIVGYISPALSRFFHTDHHDVGWFIFRRVMWSIVFITVAGIGICCTMDNRKRRSFRDGSSRERVSSRRDQDRGAYRRRY